MRPLALFPLDSLDERKGSPEAQDQLMEKRFLVSSALLTPSAALHVALDNSLGIAGKEGEEADEAPETLILAPSRTATHREALIRPDEFLSVYGSCPALHQRLGHATFKFFPTLKHLQFWTDGFSVAPQAQTNEGLELRAWPRRLIVWNLSQLLPKPATIGMLTQLLASLLETQSHIERHSGRDTELILLDTQLHRQELPITMHQHPSTPSHRDAVVSAWEACGRFVDWRASVSREITEEGLEASQYEARHLKFEQTQKDPRELGLFSQTPLHAWRML